MLSEEAKAALERYRTTLSKLRELAGEGGDVGDKLVRMMGLPSDDLNQFGEDGVKLAEILVDDLYPVRTLNGMVIRWDDEITPERLFACGFVYKDNRHVWPDGEMLWRDEATTWRQDGFPVWRVGGAYIVRELQPRNMGELWILMERCGIEVPT